MPGRIFISYRRDDTRADARSIDQRLRRTFGGHRVFFDVDTIQKGRDFRKVLADALAESLLAVIGPNWVKLRDEHGRRRIDDPGDYVRLEITSALARDIAVVPVLVGGAKMPAAGEFPEEIRALAYRSAAIITHENFAHDMTGLERDIAAMIGPEPSRKRRPRLLIAASTALALAAAGVLSAGMLGMLPNLAVTPVSTGTLGTSDQPAAGLHSTEAGHRRRAEAEQPKPKANPEPAPEKARSPVEGETATRAREEELEQFKKELRKRELRLSGLIHFGRDCAFVAVPEVSVAFPPQYGSIVFRSEVVTNYTRPSDPAWGSRCDGRKYPGRVAYYVPSPLHLDRRDKDNVIIRIRYRSGVVSLWTFDIDLGTRSAQRTKVEREN